VVVCLRLKHCLLWQVCVVDIFCLLVVKLVNYNHWLKCEMTDKDSPSPTIVQSNLKLLLEQSSVFPLIGK